jgi:hypothetical protein
MIEAFNRIAAALESIETDARDAAWHPPSVTAM